MTVLYLIIIPTTLQSSSRVCLTFGVAQSCDEMLAAFRLIDFTPSRNL